MNQPGNTPLFFAHANGIPGPCYRILFDYLPAFEVDSIPIMGQASPHPASWQELADEIISHLKRYHNQPVHGIGHSFGGVAVFFAARKRPDLFSSIIVLDPPLFSWKRRWLAAPFQWAGMAHKVVPPAIKALRRREWFPSREEARDYFSAKRFFQAFHPQAFEDYLHYGLTEADSGVTLTIPRKKEAQYFAVFPARIGKTTLLVPAHYVVPNQKTVVPATHIPELKQKFSAWQWHEVNGTHMFPLEFPKETAALIRSLVC